jgi:GTP cyclohydrolase I
VGIKDISHPIIFIDRDGKKNPTVGNFTMTVELPEHVKGTHMSRFIEILNEGPCEFNSENFNKIIDKVREKLESKTAHIVSPYFEILFEHGQRLVTGTTTFIIASEMP